MHKELKIIRFNFERGKEGRWRPVPLFVYHDGIRLIILTVILETLSMVDSGTWTCVHLPSGNSKSRSYSKFSVFYILRMFKNHFFFTSTEHKVKFFENQVTDFLRERCAERIFFPYRNRRDAKVSRKSRNHRMRKSSKNTKDRELPQSLRFSSYLATPWLDNSWVGTPEDQ